MLKSFIVSPWLILDRVPLIDHPSDLIDIQVVPASYTDTRYRSWKFAVRSWLPRLKNAGFELVSHWHVPEDRWSILDLDTGKMRWQAQHDHGFLLRSNQSVLDYQIFLNSECDPYKAFPLDQARPNKLILGCVIVEFCFQRSLSMALKQILCFCR